MLGWNWEASAGSSQPVTGGVGSVAVSQVGSLRSGRPSGSVTPGFSQESRMSFQVGSASEQSTGFDRNGAPELPDPCSEGTPKKVAEKALMPTRVALVDPITRP